MRLEWTAALVALWMTIAPAVSAAAASTQHRFTVEECELYLTESAGSPSAEAHARAAELEDWIRFRHPVLRGAAERASSVDTKFDLLFSATGYAVPPEGTNMVTHFARAARTTFGFNRFARVIERDIVATLVNDGALDPELRRRLITRILSRSMFILNTLVAYQSRPTAQRPAYYQDVELNMPKLKIEAWSAFTTADMIKMEDMVSWLDDPSVRMALVLRIFGSARSMLIDLQKLYKSLQNCTTPELFNLLVRQGLALPNAAPAPTGPAPPAIANLRSFGEEAREPESLTALHRDLHAALGVLNANLAQFQALREREVDPESWKGLLEKSHESLARFTDKIADVEAYAFLVLDRIGPLAKTFDELSGWYERTNAYVAERDHDKSSLVNLPPFEQVLLTAIVTMLPQHRDLMDRAQLSLHTHRVRLLKRLSILANLKWLVGNALERSVASNASGGPLNETREYRAVVEALEQLANDGVALE